MTKTAAPASPAPAWFSGTLTWDSIARLVGSGVEHAGRRLTGEARLSIGDVDLGEPRQVQWTEEGYLVTFEGPETPTSGTVVLSDHSDVVLSWESDAISGPVEVALVGEG